MSQENILVLAAHPDDEVLGCGGYINKLSQNGSNINVITFTDGGSSRGDKKDRRYQLELSSKILGFNILEMLNFPDNELDKISLLEINRSVEKILTRLNKFPDIILTHNPWCLNVDHKKVFECSQVISRMQHSKIMCFEIPSSSEWNHVSNFSPNCYVTLEKKHVEFKMMALNTCYLSEMRQYPHPRSLENITNTLKFNGSVIGVEYAERFMIVKEVI